MFNKKIFYSTYLVALFIPVHQKAIAPFLTYAPETWQQEMLRMVNEIRSNGCVCGTQKMPPAKPLRWNNKLAKAAQQHADDMHQNQFIGHNGSAGSRIGQRVSAAGYNWKSVAENVSWNIRTASGAVLGWKNSPDHCRSMMGGYTEMGAGWKGRYWVQVFARPFKY